jgi:thiamine transport system ATP-binding protein
MLEVRNISMSFGQVTVLDNVSASVARGEIVALLGPSGSGKSTLLRVIAGIVHPDTGMVRLDGHDVSDTPTHQRSVGMVFQNEQLFPHLNVEGNLEFGLRMTGADSRTRSDRVTELLELIGLPELAKRSIAQLSGGEAKRVALARSLAPRPKMMLLDEPLTGLDASLRERLATDVAGVLRASGSTALWVTHDADEASLVADRIIHLAEL